MLDGIAFDGLGHAVFPVARIEINGETEYSYSTDAFEKAKENYDTYSVTYTAALMDSPDISFDTPVYTREDCEICLGIREEETIPDAPAFTPYAPQLNNTAALTTKLQELEQQLLDTQLALCELYERQV